MNMMSPDISLSNAEAVNETRRQHENIEKAKGYVKKLSEELGRPLTLFLKTFGCTMNSKNKMPKTL